MATIKHVLVIHASVDTVYEKLTLQSGLSAWWTTDTVAKAEVGFVNEFRFGERFFNRMKITELKPSEAVGWTCVEADPEWVGTEIAFRLESQGSNTLVRFTHSAWREETDFFGNCNFNWGLYLRSLKSLCETGKGEPFSAVASQQQNAS